MQQCGWQYITTNKVLTGIHVILMQQLVPIWYIIIVPCSEADHSEVINSTLLDTCHCFHYYYVLVVAILQDLCDVVTITLQE